jgi:hypothetical protein
MHHDEEEALPVLTEAAPLLIQWKGQPREGWLHVVPFPVGPEVDGDWEGSWKSARDAFVGSAQRAVALSLQHAGPRGLLRRQSVAQLLQDAASEMGQCGAVILEQLTAEQALAEVGGWDAQRLGDWAAWSSQLPEHCVPVVVLDVSDLAPAAQLHLAMADLPTGLLLALKGWGGIDSCEVPWLGVDVPTSRGVVAQSASESFELEKSEFAHRIGVVIPPDRCRSEQDTRELLHAIQLCDQRGWSTRIIREEQIHQSWHGLSALVVLGDRLTGQGRRQCAGFYAAGGLVFWLRAPTGMVDEQDFRNCHEFPILE